LAIVYRRTAELSTGDPVRRNHFMQRSIQLALDHGFDPHPGCYTWLAHQAKARLDFTEAERNFRRAIEVNAKLTWVNDRNGQNYNWQRLGQLYEQTNRLDDAELAYRAALRGALLLAIDYPHIPRCTNGVSHFARIVVKFLKTHGRNEEAEELLEELLCEFPDSPDLRSALLELLPPQQAS
jgi:tetratricopeptide (TPR) repeat protein